MKLNLLVNGSYIKIIKKHIEEFTDNPMYDDLNFHMKWELLKAEIRAVSQQFSRLIQSNKHNHTNRRDSLNDLEKRLSNDPSDKYLQDEINKTKKELEISELEKTRRAQVRARIKWAGEGERSTKFFLNLDKSRAQGNTIHRLVKDDGSFLNTSGEIIKEVHRYYKILYKENKEIDEIGKATQGYARNLTFPKVSEQDKAKTEEELTETELSSALPTMKNGSAPGPDGIPVEFYKTFWPDVKFLFMNSLHYSHTIGILSPTQRHGTISLIHKGKDLVKDKLTNWRPISLTNADYKIISKALALIVCLSESKG